MKKLIAILAVFFVIGTISAFAHGIGLQGGANISAKGGANIGGSGAITFKLDSLPWVFAVDGAFYSDYIGLGLTADMWIGNPVISKPLRCTMAGVLPVPSVLVTLLVFLQDFVFLQG